MFRLPSTIGKVMGFRNNNTEKATAPTAAQEPPPVKSKPQAAEEMTGDGQRRKGFPPPKAPQKALLPGKVGKLSTEEQHPETTNLSNFGVTLEHKIVDYDYQLLKDMEQLSKPDARHP